MHEFHHNGDVLVNGEYIGRIEADGYLALAEECRDVEIANAVITALREQITDAEATPAFGWMPEHHALAVAGECNV